jgi:hypothetical protein
MRYKQMREYLKILDQVPPELRDPLADLVEVVRNELRTEMGITRHDFSHLEQIVTELAESQKRSEGRIDRLELAVAELVEGQKRTDQRIEEMTVSIRKLTEAQNQIEKQIEEMTISIRELAVALKRTDERLTASIQEVREAQERADQHFKRFERRHISQMGRIGKRWGQSVEDSYRDSIRFILRDLGLQVEGYLKFDDDGEVYGSPAPVEIDVVIKDGLLVLVEIKASTDRGDVAEFYRAIRFYEKQEGVTVDRKVLVSPFVYPRAMELANTFGMEVFTDINEVE